MGARWSEPRSIEIDGDWCSYQHDGEMVRVYHPEIGSIAAVLHHSPSRLLAKIMARELNEKPRRS